MSNTIGSGVSTNSELYLKPGVKKADFEAEVKKAAEDGTIDQKEFQKLGSLVNGDTAQLTKLLDGLGIKSDINGAFSVPKVPSEKDKSVVLKFLQGAKDSDSIKADSYMKLLNPNNDGVVTRKEMMEFKAKVISGEIKIDSIPALKEVFERAKVMNKGKESSGGEICPADVISSHVTDMINGIDVLEKKMIFSGKNEGVVNVFDSKKTADDCFKTVSEYPGLKGTGFSRDSLYPLGVKFDPNELNVGDFYKLFGESGAPKIDGTGTAYEQIVGAKVKGGESYIDKLKTNILKMDKNNLTPSDVLKCALDATNGDYALATLAAHNLLKNIAYRARTDGASKLDDKELAIVSKLGNLRPSGGGDKMGPWYHFMGVQAAMAVTGSSAVATNLVDFEHTSRSDGALYVRKATGAAAKAFGAGAAQALSPEDKEKAAVDQASCDAANKLFAKYSSMGGYIADAGVDGILTGLNAAPKVLMKIVEGYGRIADLF